MKVPVTLWTSLICAALLTLTAAAESAEAIRMGAVFALTGPLAAAGQDAKNGAQLAADTVNQAGGIKSLGGAHVKMVFGDSQSKPATAASEAERLITQSKVVIITGANTSAETIPMSVVPERYGVPMIVTNAQSEEVTNRGFKWLWSLGLSDRDFVDAALKALEFAHQLKPSLKKIAIVSDDSETGQSSTRVFRELADRDPNFEVVGEIQYSGRAQEFGPTVLKLKQTGAQMAVLCCFLRQVVGLSRAFDQFDFHPVIATMGGGTADPKFGDTVGKSAEGIFNATGFAFDLPKTQKVIAAYKSKYNASISTNAAHAYQAVMTMVAAVEKAGSTDPAALSKTLSAIRIPSENIITSPAYIEFGADRRNKGRRAYLTQWQNGSLVTIWPEDVATSKPLMPPINTAQ